MNKNMKYSKELIQEIKAVADPLLIALWINMDVDLSQDEIRSILHAGQNLEKTDDYHDYRRHRISVLCPGHDDHHFGSCYITSNGCRCYVCDKEYDVFDMVRLHQKISFGKALKIVAEYCGGLEHFLPSGNESGSASRLISRADMDLIGIVNTPVYGLFEILPEYMHMSREPGTRHIWIPGDPEQDDSGYIAVEKCILKNPLQELLLQSPGEYKRLIREKAREALIDYQDEQKRLSSFSHSQARALIPPIRRIEEIYIEYGGSLRTLKHARSL